MYSCAHAITITTASAAGKSCGRCCNVIPVLFQKRNGCTHMDIYMYILITKPTANE